MQSLSVQAVLVGGVVVAAFLVYVPFGLVAYGRLQLGMQALATPRAVVDKLPAYAQRATWAHQNSFEAFTLFAAACLLAYVTGITGGWVMGAVIAHLSARLLYSIFYILNVPLLRSLMFGIGSLSSATLMISSFLKVF
ncbi:MULTISPECIES: MAPEG family protein [unclassified Leptolyngbya]|uniref:MAPEG family protein n=1 Tax=unclassified Leptolyngbya TaxID=2650499 RepID=UPI001686FF2E|nr:MULTISPECIES: MAPEG family protein [unclassified Leptolyngbya]MBD1910981.1 MAPEG family protein [Leptolyngbya sp. FACHB-8]MBD2158352.1 MAPEG family protein [Leptolyngbya sp. FACHB-16]